MSEPKRYKLRPIFWDYIQVKSVSKDQIDAMGNESAYFHKDGDWVKWEDYARLKAEVERLTAFTTRTIIPNEELKVDLENCRIALRVKYEEVAKFKAQVERLTKAGDEMARVISSFGFDEAPIAWNRAKEGKQSS
jgi:hypothetical protein